MRPPDEPSERLNQEAWSSQRNIVFPDTVRNEFRGYERLLNGPGLKRYQKVGALLLAPIFLLMGFGMVISCVFFPRVAAELVNSTWFGVAMIPFGLVLAGIGIAFAVFGFRLLKRTL